jgi:hypothetical protein
VFNGWPLNFNLVVLTIVGADHPIHMIGFVVKLLLHRDDVVAGVVCFVGLIDSGPILLNLVPVILLSSDVSIQWRCRDNCRKGYV